jgi:hypothetical protein
MIVFYDRYTNFRSNNKVSMVPFIPIPYENGDKTFIFKKGQTRLDKVSDEYYNNPYHGWLILAANPQFGGLEFNIPNSARLIIPFPFDSGLKRYADAVTTYKNLYGE